MWVMTSAGFFSAVEDRNNNLNVIVRARAETDIKKMAALTGSRYAKTPDADYPYRLTCGKEVWANTLKVLALNINYDNFKNSVTDDDHREAYHAVWTDMHAIDDRYKNYWSGWMVH